MPWWRRTFSTEYLRPMRRLIEETGRETFEDILDARLILETASAERAAQFADAEDLVALADALEAIRQTPPGSPAAEQAHSTFHIAVADASHNLFLARMLKPLIESHIANDPARSLQTSRRCWTHRFADRLRGPCQDPASHSRSPRGGGSARHARASEYHHPPPSRPSSLAVPQGGLPP